MAVTNPPKEEAATSRVLHPRPVALAHVVLRTTPDQYRAMVNFYLDVLQAEIVHEAPTFAFLRYDYEHHRVAIIQVPGTTAKPDSIVVPGIEHMAFTYPTLTDLALTYRSLKAMKEPILPLWGVNHGPTTSLYYRDPDSNKVELQVDNFDDAQAADDFMRGPLFRENPVGTDLDIDKWADGVLGKMLEDGQEGLSPAEIRDYKIRKEIGPRMTFPNGLFDSPK